MDNPLADNAHALFSSKPLKVQYFYTIAKFLRVVKEVEPYTFVFEVFFAQIEHPFEVVH